MVERRQGNFSIKYLMSTLAAFENTNDLEFCIMILGGTWVSVTEMCAARVENHSSGNDDRRGLIKIRV